MTGTPTTGTAVTGGGDRHAVLRAGLLVVAGAVLLAALALTGPSWLRVPVAVLWLAAMPGLPWAVRLRLGDRGDTAALAVAISLALAALIGGGMAVLGWWSPWAAVLVLTGAGLCALVPPRRTPPPPTVPHGRPDDA